MKHPQPSLLHPNPNLSGLSHAVHGSVSWPAARLPGPSSPLPRSRAPAAPPSERGWGSRESGLPLSQSHQSKLNLSDPRFYFSENLCSLKKKMDYSLCETVLNPKVETDTSNSFWNILPGLILETPSSAPSPASSSKEAPVYGATLPYFSPHPALAQGSILPIPGSRWASPHSLFFPLAHPSR